MLRAVGIQSLKFFTRRASELLGHFPHRETPKQVAEAIIGWLQANR
jgi:hypothetical protein